MQPQEINTAGDTEVDVKSTVKTEESKGSTIRSPALLLTARRNQAGAPKRKSTAFPERLQRTAPPAARTVPRARSASKTLRTACPVIMTIELVNNTLSSKFESCCVTGRTSPVKQFLILLAKASSLSLIISEQTVQNMDCFAEVSRSDSDIQVFQTVLPGCRC